MCLFLVLSLCTSNHPGLLPLPPYLPLLVLVFRPYPHTRHSSSPIFPLCTLPCVCSACIGRSIGDDDSSVTSYGVHRGPFSIGGRGHLAGGGGRMAGGSYVSGGSGGLSYQHMWPRDYIQDLQQNLALRYARAPRARAWLNHREQFRSIHNWS